MHDHCKVFCCYVEGLIYEVPIWVYVIALTIIIIGSIIAFTKRGRNEGLRISACLFLLLYVIVLFCSTVFFRATKTTRHYPFDFLWHYKAIGQGMMLYFPEIIMNIVVFIPIGFVIGLIFRKTSGWQTILAGMSISVGVELFQWFFRKGFADVDDVIHNTLGCLVGFVLWRGCAKWILRSKSYTNLP